MVDARSTEHTLQSQSCVVVTVVEIKGSAPREEGATLTVFDSYEIGTIGGGSMELEALHKARQILLEGGAEAFTELSRKRLESSYDQCCGGAVVLMFEYFPVNDVSGLSSVMSSLRAKQGAYVLISHSTFDSPTEHCNALITIDKSTDADFCDRGITDDEIELAREMLGDFEGAGTLCRVRELEGNTASVFRLFVPQDFNITLFGAGHVGRALVHVLASLDCAIRWVDSRSDIFPELIPDNTDTIFSETPAAQVTGAPANSLFLVMTHSHSLDYEICDHILARDDVLFLGLIGSKSKMLQFTREFKRRGLSDDQVNRITCPIGIAGITNKSAGAIAVSAAAQLLSIYESHKTESTSKDRRSVETYN